MNIVLIYFKWMKLNVPCNVSHSTRQLNSKSSSLNFTLLQIHLNVRYLCYAHIVKYTFLNFLKKQNYAILLAESFTKHLYKVFIEPCTKKYIMEEKHIVWPHQSANIIGLLRRRQRRRHSGFISGAAAAAAQKVHPQIILYVPSAQNHHSKSNSNRTFSSKYI